MKTVANLASFPARILTLKTVLDQISHQFDQINLVLNEYDSVPNFINSYQNVSAILPDEDLKDLGKFFPDISGFDTVFLLDDDIFYPQDYVSRTLSLISSKRHAYTYHGGILTPAPNILSITHWKRTLRRLRKGYDDPHKYRTLFHFSEEQKKPHRVNLPGTGASVLFPSIFPPFGYMSGSCGFVDIRLGRWLFEQNIPLVSLPKEAGWLAPMDSPDDLFSRVTQKRTNPYVEELDRLVSLL